MNALEVFYVESTVHQIHYIVQVTFSREDLQKYVNGMIRPLLRLHVEPIVKILEQKSKLDFEVNGYVCDTHTLKQSFFIAEELYDWVVTNNKPLPPCRSIVPTTVHLWNHLKGGVDIYSRYISNLGYNHKRLNLYGRLFLRAFKTLLHNACQTNKMFSYRQKFGVEVKSFQTSVQDCLTWEVTLTSFCLLCYVPWIQFSSSRTMQTLIIVPRD